MLETVRIGEMANIVAVREMLHDVATRKMSNIAVTCDTVDKTIRIPELGERDKVWEIIKLINCHGNN